MRLLFGIWVTLAHGATRLHDEVPVVGRLEPAPGPGFDPLHLSDEVRTWLKHAPIRGTDDDTRMVSLVRALREAKPWQFTQVHTGTATEVFAEGRFNCLGLSHLIVALGRELGVDARYVLVEDRRTYQERADLVLSSTHVTAAWGPAHSPRLIELEAVDSPGAALASVPLDDAHALALHFANRGAELLLSGQPALARDWLAQGLITAPEVPELWTNLGVARRALGDEAGAEEAWMRAIALDPQNLSAYRDLASLYLRRRDPDEARRLLAIALRPGRGGPLGSAGAPSDDPFTWLALGDLHLHIDRDGAARFYRRAAHLDPHNPRVLSARAELALLDGRLHRAETLVRRALSRDPADGRAQSVNDRLPGAAAPR
jgi:Flp pilus assembly protein TadD